MLSREELMAKINGFTDGELENAVRSIELQRQIDENMKKDRATRIENAKTKLSKISISIVGAVSADNTADLLSEVNKMNEALNEGMKEAPEGSMTIEKFNVNCSEFLATCNFIVNVDLNKDQINELNKKIGRVFF